MLRLAAVYLTFLVLLTSVLPLAFARETNAQRFRRGAPPLPPSRRGGAYPAQPSSKPPPHGSGYVLVRDINGLQDLGYFLNTQDRGPLISVTPLDSAKSLWLKATFSGSAHTLVATNAAFPAPYFLGSQYPFSNDPGLAPPEEILFTNVPDSPGAEVWSYDPNTQELTINLPKPNGGSVPAVFAWDIYQNAIELVTDVPAFLAGTQIGEPANQQPILVRLYFA